MIFGQKFAIPAKVGTEHCVFRTEGESVENLRKLFLNEQVSFLE
jgi:hypothetical protein